jgi:LacI family transcriptional regulator, repressor for deo operon, udp, cdd, tsx, nupC, and nupG
MKNHQVTIIDIARRLGISKSTVSRALTGHSQVNKETRNKILELAQELDYQRNNMALSLARSQSFSLGIVIPELMSSFFPSVISGIQQVVSEMGYSLLICQSNESYRTEITNVKSLVAGQIDGLMVSMSKETSEIEHLKALQRKGIPLVMFNRVSDEIESSKVIVNDHEGAFEAVEHLILSGCKRIAHLAGPQNLIISRERLRGYTDALLTYDLPIDNNLIIEYDLSPEQAKITTMRLLDLPVIPDAFFCFNDPTAIEVMKILWARGIAVPEQIALVGFSDDAASALIELTTVAQPVVEMGQLTAQLLLAQIENPLEEYQPETRLLRTKLIVRKSSMRS